MLASVLLLAAALAAPPASAQTAGPPSDAPTRGTFDGLLRAFDLKTTPSEPPDFVRRSRPATTDFIPVGRPHPERTIKVLTPEEVQAQTDSLDKARTAQQRAAGIKPPPVPLKPPKGAAARAKPKVP